MVKACDTLRYLLPKMRLWYWICSGEYLSSENGKCFEADLLLWYDKSKQRVCRYVPTPNEVFILLAESHLCYKHSTRIISFSP